MRTARVVGTVTVAAITGFGTVRWLFPEWTSAPGSVGALAIAAPPIPAGVAWNREVRLQTNARVALDSASLGSDRPVVLRLDLGAPSLTQDPRPVRIFSTDGREFKGQGALEEGGFEARLEVAPNFLLKPGLYMVEVTTTELTHLPTRRYVIDVR